MSIRRLAALATVLLAVACAFISGDDQNTPLRRIGTILHPPMRETSGLVKSRRHADVYWAANDSGNRPYLFAIDRKGNLLAEYHLKQAPNVDWEALTQDDEGNLYVCDVGNNFIGLPRRMIYQVREPETLAAYSPGQPPPELAPSKKFPYLFPDRPFDVEAAFFHRGSIYLVNKVGKEKTTMLFRLPLESPDKDVTLQAVCPLPGVHVVTDASLSPDGKRLALCGYDWAACYDLDPERPMEQLREKTPVLVRFPRTEIEACTWDGDELILASESREIYALRFGSRQ